MDYRVLLWWLGLDVGKEYEFLMPQTHIGCFECGSMEVGNCGASYYVVACSADVSLFADS